MKNRLNKNAIAGLLILVAGAVLLSSLHLWIALAIKVLPQSRTIYFGDSITAWDTTIPKADDRGVPGDTTEQMLGRFQRDVIDGRPDAVVILAGINDVGRPGQAIDTEGNIREMVREARQAGIRVTLCTLLPTSQDVAAGRSRYSAKDPQRVLAINKFILSVPHTKKFDYYAATVGTDGFAKAGALYDGLHPSAEGYAGMLSVR